MTTPAPTRISLANTPTPLVHLERTSAELGVELWVKRDDLTGLELSGNKVRKLEFILADALAEGADTIVTCGGEQSNHCRATAMAAARLGLASHLVLRTDDPERPPRPTGNILLDRLAGATTRWIPVAAWPERAAIMAEEARVLAAVGRRPYLVPEGGSNALGAWGYVRAAEELAAQLAPLPAKPTTIVYACGSGGTGAGLILGARRAGLEAMGVRVAGVNVCDDRAYFVRAIGAICAEFERRWPGEVAAITADDIDLIDGYVGLGYARSRAEELDALIALARREALLLDPVYTGKAFYGMTRELLGGRRLGERVIFLHTGGVFGLFPIAEQLAPRL